MNVKPVTGPGMDPGKSVIFEKKFRFEPVMVNRFVFEIAADLPCHQQSKRDPEENKGCDIDRRERANFDSVQKAFHRRSPGMRVLTDPAFETNAFFRHGNNNCPGLRARHIRWALWFGTSWRFVCLR